MATITATIDKGGMNYAFGIVSGTFTTTNNEGGSNGLAGPAVDQIVLLPTTAYITSFDATCEDGAASVRAKCNVNSAGTATNGTVLIETNSIGDQVFRFLAHFLGG